jgi:hypothetical protein
MYIGIYCHVLLAKSPFPWCLALFLRLHLCMERRLFVCFLHFDGL